MNFGFYPICNYREIAQLQLLYNPWRPSCIQEKQSCLHHALSFSIVMRSMVYMFCWAKTVINKPFEGHG